MKRFTATVLMTGLFLGAGATAASASPGTRPAPNPMVAQSVAQTACASYLCELSPTADK